MKNWVKLIESELMIEFPGESFLLISNFSFLFFPGFLVNSAILEAELEVEEREKNVGKRALISEMGF